MLKKFLKIINDLLHFIFFQLLYKKLLTNSVISFTQSLGSIDLEIQKISDELNFIYKQIHEFKIEELDVTSKLRTSVIGNNDELGINLLKELSKILIKINDAESKLTVYSKRLQDILLMVNAIRAKIIKMTPKVKISKFNTILQKKEELSKLQHKFVFAFRRCEVTLNELHEHLNQIKTLSSRNYFSEDLLEALQNNENIDFTYQQIKANVLSKISNNID